MCACACVRVCAFADWCKWWQILDAHPRFGDHQQMVTSPFAISIAMDLKRFKYICSLNFSSFRAKSPFSCVYNKVTHLPHFFFNERSPFSLSKWSLFWIWSCLLFCKIFEVVLSCHHLENTTPHKNSSSDSIILKHIQFYKKNMC